MTLPEFEKVKVEIYHYNNESWKVVMYPCLSNGWAYKTGGGFYLATFKTREVAREYKRVLEMGLANVMSYFGDYAAEE